jgi:hypothetical protein
MLLYLQRPKAYSQRNFNNLTRIAYPTSHSKTIKLVFIFQVIKYKVVIRLDAVLSFRWIKLVSLVMVWFM